MESRKTPKRTHLKKINSRQIRNLKSEMRNFPHSSSKNLFKNTNLPIMSKSMRCNILRKIGKVRTPIKTPPLNKMHKIKRVNWATKYLKLDFKKVIFTDECRATLDGPDGWASGWILHGNKPQMRYKRQQGGGGVMFWAAIMNNELIGPFKIKKGVKLNSKNYSDFLKQNFFPWLEQKLKNNAKFDFMFQQDNATCHKSLFTKKILIEYGIKNEKLMVWPPCSPDLNPIENLWSIIKRKVYESNQQYTNLEDLWGKIAEVSKKIKPEEIKNLTSSMDRRLVRVLEKGGGRVDIK